ncbi:sperm motility kinase-like [Onychomys torridus]|uniref:sperm motility kinase-like n=1 Tax=Onychomys torridus TaxID=38674 RepID=UPI00167F7E41|nr:sperm motility kinase-like [Onychomys torridus]
MASPLEENILDKDFRILTSLASGGFGEVKLACHLPTHTWVAVKVLEKKKNSLAHINNEAKILQSVEHRNIVRFFHVIDTSSTTFVIMEYIAGKDLEYFLRGKDFLKENEARPIFQQVVSGVHFLHQKRIAHRDIKLENILIDRAGNIKLCDFGMARQLAEGQMLEDFYGTLVYLAPEILARKPYNGLVGDMWSLGVLLYMMVTGKFPYDENSYDRMYRVIKNTMYPFPYNVSKPCLIIIARLLMVPTQYRITICQLQKSRWLGNIKEHAAPATKEILPRVVDTMYNMGYTFEEIVLSLKHRQPNNLMATFNILKYKLSCGDSHQQNQKPWLNDSPVDPLCLLPPLKRRASEPAFPTNIGDGKRHFHEEGVEGRGKRCQSYTMLNMPCADEAVPEGGILMANVIKGAITHSATHMKSVDSLPGDLSSGESALDGTSTRFLKMDFALDEPFMGPNNSNDQPQDEPTTSGSRPLRSWKLMKKRISHALRALFSCSMPTLL